MNPIHLVDIQHHPKRQYEAKDFNQQEGYKFRFDTQGRLPIEVGAYLHWDADKPLDIAIDLSCMSGCTEHCTFCAAAGPNNPRRTLEPEEIVEQATMALCYVEAAHPQFVNAIRKNGKLTLSFEGMGEPSRCPLEIQETISLLRSEFKDRIPTQFIISTTLADIRALDWWGSIGLHSLQVSLHAPFDETRKKLLGRCESLDKIFAAIEVFRTKSPATQIKLNYLLLEGENDAPQDAVELARRIKGKSYFLKLSRLNDTNAAREHHYRPASDASFEQFRAKLRKESPSSAVYYYGSRHQLQMSCGQLATYAGSKCPADVEKAIANIYSKVSEGRVVLFLGPEASSALLNSPAVAALLYGKLGHSGPPPQELRLADMFDIFEAANRRAELNSVLEPFLAKGKYPEQFLHVCRFPWKVIYTTDCSRFLERAYNDAKQRRLTDYNCVPIIEDKDLGTQLFPNDIRIVKLHGCISKGVENVVIGRDEHTATYRTQSERLFKKLESDLACSDVIFADCSMRDHTLLNLIRDSRRARPSNDPAYAILPEWTHSIEQSAFLKKYNVEVISCSLATFVNQITRHASRPVVYLCGSSKAPVTGGRRHRKDCVKQISEMAIWLAKALDRDGFEVLIGATATDKFGYLVTSKMERKDLVTTLLWNGAEEIDAATVGDEIPQMIKKTYYGRNAEHVMGKATRMAQAVVLVGGAGMTMREFYWAMLANKLIIPVALGDAGYASDIVHKSISFNLDSLENFADDPGLSLKQADWNAVHELLTAARLERLRLNLYTPKEVADTIMEILHALRMSVSFSTQP